jgi:hypothetical protein
VEVAGVSPARQRTRVGDRREGDERGDRPRRKADRRARWIERVCVALAIACFVGGWVSLQNQADHITRNAADSRRTAVDSKHTATRLAAVVREIQAQRRTNIRKNCEDQNIRHDRTIRRLKMIARAKHVPDARIQPSIRLIDALAPRHDCVRLSEQQTGGR